MSNPNNPGIDLSAPGEGDNQLQSPAQDNIPPSPAPNPYFLQQELRNDLERRIMRYSLFSVIMLFAILFLSFGLYFALDVGQGLLKSKQDIVGTLTNSNVTECFVPLKCIPQQNKGLSEVVANLNADWLSASSMIMIAAFILGVGLTLILTLLKSSFRHPTDSLVKNDTNQTSLEIATPLSEIIASVISYIRDKFSK